MSSKHASSVPLSNTSSSSSSSSSSSKTTPHDTEITPSPTSSDDRTPNYNISINMETGKLDPAEEGKQKEEADLQNEGEPATGLTEVVRKDAADNISPKPKVKCSKDHKPKKGKKRGKKAVKEESDSDSSSGDSSDSSDDSSSSEDSDEEDKKSKRRKARRKMSKRKAAKQAAKKARHDSSDDSSGSDSSDSSSSEDESQRKHRKRKSKKVSSDESEDEDEQPEPEPRVEEAVVEEVTPAVNVNEQIAALLQALAQVQGGSTSATRAAKLPPTEAPPPAVPPETKLRSRKGKAVKEKKAKKPKKGTTVDFKRVNHLWDTNSHQWVTKEEIDEETDEFDEFAFTVRRNFDWDNHYTKTSIDIKSKLLKEVLEEVMKDVQGETLEAEEPSVDPNMLFLYLEELRTHYKKTLKSRLKKDKKRRNKKKTKDMISHCKCLVRYLDEDYADTKKTLYPLLEVGNITFDLLWALFKPNTIAYTSTYGDHENPRCFKVDRATKEQSFIKGEWYSIEGRYLEYDGKNFGLGEFEVNVEAFKGSRKITSLAAYPLKYHKDPDSITVQLVERGKRFIQMTGQNYRFHKGLAFQKKRKGIQKFNINGRVMIDPATFRRINPNYQISVLKPKEEDDDSDSDSDEDGCGCEHSSDEGDGKLMRRGEDEKERGPKTAFKLIQDSKKKWHVIEVTVDEDGHMLRPEKLDMLATDTDAKSRSFTEEELLIASPVVLGFAFSEKGWLEFSLNGITDIEWNNDAFESLVQPAAQKHVLKALVSSHKFHAAETIDDVVQGKGRGRVFVLHGPPGVGKTLTAEGVAEDLRVPLYAVSMGELGTETNRLEVMLNQIMDIAHSWGAVLLLDEADVFLEKRQHQDVHRNALVSIFLRQLEYFQGILFLTTNRVETFDEAFQSRIHMALKYDDLTPAAQKKIWREFIERVRVKEGIEIMPFTNDDYDYLSRRKLNGRQIKNTVSTAQALSLYEKQSFSLEHIKRVLEVAESFDRDLKGGTGYLDAMRSYT